MGCIGLVVFLLVLVFGVRVGAGGSFSLLCAAEAPPLRLYFFQFCLCSLLCCWRSTCSSALFSASLAC